MTLRYKTGFVAIPLVAVLFLSIAIFINEPAKAAPALVINPAGECAFLDGDGGIFVTTDTKIVVTQSNHLNAHLTCSATDVPNSSGRAITYNSIDNPTDPHVDILCEVFRPDGNLYTDEWTETISASGNAKLQCHAKD